VLKLQLFSFTNRLKIHNIYELTFTRLAATERRTINPDTLHLTLYNLFMFFLFLTMILEFYDAVCLSYLLQAKSSCLSCFHTVCARWSESILPSVSA